MTKSINITYNEADESLLMALFAKFKITTQAVIHSFAPSPLSNDDETERPPTKEEFLAGLQESINEMKAFERGEIELPTLADFLKELEAEEASIV